MVYRVLCLFHTACKQEQKDDGKAKRDKVYSFLVKTKSDEKQKEIEAFGICTSHLYAVGVERLNTQCIERALSIQLLRVGFELIGLTNIHSSVVNERFTSRAAIAAIQVQDQVFRERLPFGHQYIWLTFEEATKWFLDKKLDELVYQAMKNLMDNKLLPLRSVDEEVMTAENAYKNVISQLTDNQRALMEGAGFQEAQIARLNEIFVEMVYPDCMMNYTQFDRFFTLHEMRSGEDLRALYRAVNISKERGVTFHDFLLALAAFQPLTPHGRTTGDIRSRYIFRYFCTDCDQKGGVLARAEVEALFVHIEKKNRSAVNPRADIDEILNTPPLTMYRFLKLVGTLKIRGTSCILRMRRPLAAELYRPENQRLLIGESGGTPPPGSGVRLNFGVYGQSEAQNPPTGQGNFGVGTPEESGVRLVSTMPTKGRPPSKRRSNMATGNNSAFTVSNTGSSRTRLSLHSARDSMSRFESTSSRVSPTMQEEDMSLNPYILRPSMSGTCINELFTVENAREMSERSKQEIVGNAVGQNFKYFIYHHAEPRMIEKAFALLASIRYFCKRCDGPDEKKRAYTWGSANRQSVMKQFFDVCANAATTLFNDERCVRLTGSVRIFSDLHGKVDDLRQFERCFFPLGIDAVNSQFLFLGNNITKGQQSFEVIGSLFAMKVLFPHKVFLIRGADEFKQTLLEEGFVNEIRAKFPDCNISELVLMMTRAFDNMPLCAIVNRKMFCSTAGIPHPDTFKDCNFIDQAAVYTKVLSEELEPLSFPHQIFFNEYVAFAPAESYTFDEYGFAYSQRHKCYIYNDDAVQRFLLNIGCTYFVRGGWLSAHGISIQCQAKMLTISSSSHLGSNRNEAACLIVNGMKARVLSIARNSR